MNSCRVVKRPVKLVSSFVPLLLLMLFESGCTYALWTNANLVAYKEPAQNPDLHLFHSGERKDFLVVYREHAERTDAIHRRAYWLNKNEHRVEDRRAPVFAHNSRATGLAPVPVFYSMPVDANLSGNFYAVCDTNNETFTLCSGRRQIRSYDFPVYHDHWGNVEKAALTPVAVTADVAAVGAVAAVYFAYGLAQGGYTIQVGK